MIWRNTDILNDFIDFRTFANKPYVVIPVKMGIQFFSRLLDSR